MLYTNVPLPKPVVDKIDKIIADPKMAIRSRPEYILLKLRHEIDQDVERLEGSGGVKQ